MKNYLSFMSIVGGVSSSEHKYRLESKLSISNVNLASICLINSNYSSILGFEHIFNI